MASFPRSVGKLCLVLRMAMFVAAVDAPGPTMPNIAPNCNKWYVAQSGDTCDNLLKSAGITRAAFLRWNPDVSVDCLQNFWPTYAYCIGVDSTLPSTRPASTSSTTSTKPSTVSGSSTATSKPASGSTTISSTVTTTSNAPYSIRNPITSWNITTPTIGNTFPPKETQAGQPSYCIDWHLVTIGDSCQNIVNRYGASFTIDNLLDWNPALYDDCSGLEIGFWVCVRIQAQSSTSLTFLPPSGSVSIPSTTNFTPTTNPAVNTSFVASPTEGPLPTNCVGFYQANAGDRCEQVLAQNPMISSEQFFAWNPVLNGDCGGMWAGYYYCIFAGGADTLPAPPTVTTKPSSAASGAPSNCAAWYQTSGGDNCDFIVSIFGRFSKSDFITWNPSVNSDCSGIKDDVAYCVAIPGTPTTRTTPIPSATPTGDPPTQSGIAPNCNDFWLVSALDTCKSIEGAKAITPDNFFAWNPAVGNSTTCSNLLPGYNVCVGTGTGGGSSTVSTTASVSKSSSATTTTFHSTTVGGTTTTRSTTTTTGAAQSTPSPIQAGMVSGCKRFYYVQPNDGCWAIANAAGIDLTSQFYVWNPAVNTDCSGLWPDYYVCIGISGTATTISGGPPVPT